MELWQHQKMALERYKDAPYFGLLFDCGLGKTLTAAQIAEVKERPVLIIAPSVLCEQWKNELTEEREDKRITTKDWNVVVCDSSTKSTQRFKREFENLCNKVSE